MKHIVSTVFVLMFIHFSMRCTAQHNVAANEGPKNSTALYVGPGLGFDHGGIGVKAEFQPVKYVGIFGGLGYNLVSAGVNGGFIYNILPDKKWCPVLTAMYGYNAALKVTASSYPGGPTGDVIQASSYNGLTVGAGVDLKYGKRKNKWSFALLVPLRSSSFHHDYSQLKQNGAQFNPGVIPVGISIGWSASLLKQHN